jgi:hypothetical protein
VIEISRAFTRRHVFLLKRVVKIVEKGESAR